MDLKEIEKRKVIELHTEFDVIEEGNSVVKGRKEKKYDFLICDYCKEKIKLIKNNIEGGTIEFSIASRTLKLALHNKCLNPALKEINNKYEGSE